MSSVNNVRRYDFLYNGINIIISNKRVSWHLLFQLIAHLQWFDSSQVLAWS